MVRSTHEAAQQASMFALENVSWELYELMLRDVDGQNVRITYDQGRMVLMSPLPIHDRLKKLLARLLETMCYELDIELVPYGSTTWKRRELEKGLEPDECYYLRNESKVRGLVDLDPQTAPPPDLAIEVDVTHHSMDRLAIYASLGVEEVWRHDGERLQAYRLQSGEYVPIELSYNLPFLRVSDLEQFLKATPAATDQQRLKRFIEWARQLPRN